MKSDIPETGVPATVGLIILCVVFPPLGLAVVSLTVFGLLCLAGTKIVQCALPQNTKLAPQQRERQAATVFGWLVTVVVVFIYVSYIIRQAAP